MPVGPIALDDLLWVAWCRGGFAITINFLYPATASAWCDVGKSGWRIYP